VLISDGNSQDDLKITAETAAEVRGTGAEVYAVTLSPDYYLPELELYAGNPNFVYIGKRIDEFIEAASSDVNSCPDTRVTPKPIAPVVPIAPPTNPACRTDKVRLRISSLSLSLSLSLKPKPNLFHTLI
jgi:hypothetical protein